jgi:hypothetical protein
MNTPQTDFDSAYDSPTEEFAFINTFELEVYNDIHQVPEIHPFSHTTLPMSLIPSLCHPAFQRRGNYQKL